MKTTYNLLESLKHYTKNSTVTISTENKDWRGKDYKSDFVTIDEQNNVGFEVFDNEILVFYFTDHKHFEDYSSELQDGEEDYIKRATDFLLELLKYRIIYLEIFKGKKLASEKYYLIYPNNTKEWIGGTWWGLTRFINPFAKRQKKTTVWKFCKSKGCFVQDDF